MADVEGSLIDHPDGEFYTVDGWTTEFIGIEGASSGTGSSPAPTPSIREEPLLPRSEP